MTTIDIQAREKKGMFKQVCKHCKDEIPPEMVQQGGLHLICFEIKIDVWFTSIPSDSKCGYYERDVSKVSEMLKDSEEAYLIERQQMMAGQFYNLPEFKGF